MKNMAQITIEMVDQVLDRLPYATYKEAREALIKTDGNVLDAIIYIESGQKDTGFENKKESIRRFGENISQESERIRGQLGDLFKKTTVVRIIVEKEGKVVLNIPLTLGVLGVAAMPVLSLLGLSAAVLSKYSVLITDEASGESVDMGSLTPEKLEILKEIIFNSFEDIRGTFKKSKDVEEDDYQDDADDDKTIKIVGFNKAEDEYLEILEGTQGLSDLEILQQMQNEEPLIDGLVTKEDDDLSNKRPNRLLQLDDTEEILGLDKDSENISGGTSLPKRRMTGPTEDVKLGHIQTSKTYVEEDNKLIQENEHEKFKNYKMPPISLLNKVSGGGDKKSKHRVLENARRLEKTLRDFGVDANINQVTVGPTITRYEIQPSPGVKVSKIVNLTDDIALSLAAKSIRMESSLEVFVASVSPQVSP